MVVTPVFAVYVPAVVVVVVVLANKDIKFKFAVCHLHFIIFGSLKYSIPSSVSRVNGGHKMSSQAAVIGELTWYI